MQPDRFEDGQPMLLGGLRQRHEFSTAEQTIAAQWREFMAEGEISGRIGQQRYGVMCGADSTGIEYMCAVQVQSLEDLPEGTGRMRVPAQRYAVFLHDGSARTLRTTWQQIMEWLADGVYQSAHQPDFELYGPSTNPLSPNDGVEVWVGVVERRQQGTSA